MVMSSHPLPQRKDHPPLDENIADTTLEIAPSQAERLWRIYSGWQPLDPPEGLVIHEKQEAEKGGHTQ